MDPREQQGLQTEVQKLSFPKFPLVIQNRSFGGTHLSDQTYFYPVANWRSARAAEESRLKELAPLTPQKEAETLEQKVPREALEDEPRTKRSRGLTIFDG